MKISLRVSLLAVLLLIVLWSGTASATGTNTWNGNGGADDRWYNYANWLNPVSWMNASDVIFPSTPVPNKTSTFDLSQPIFNTIRFEGGGFWVKNAPGTITTNLKGGLTSAQSSGVNQFDPPISLIQPQSITCVNAGAVLKLTNNLSLSVSPQIFDGNGTIEFSGYFGHTMPPSVIKKGTGTLLLKGITWHNIPITIEDGLLLVNYKTINTSSSDITITNGTLGGTSSVENINAKGGIIDPGNDGTGPGPGQFTARSNVALEKASTLQLQIESAAHDQLVVKGALAINGAGLKVDLGGYTPGLGKHWKIIDNQGSGQVIGTFAGLPEGAAVNTFPPLEIFYSAGDGNDVVLAAVAGLSVADVKVTEKDGVIASATFTISLEPKSPDTVTVDVMTADDAATAPGDYQPVKTTVTFQPNETSKDVVVNVEGDKLPESTETFKLLLSKPVNAVIQKAEGIGTIVDNDTMSEKKWTGVGANSGWMTDLNWEGNVAPVDKNDLLFADQPGQWATNVNDFPDATLFRSITLSGSGYKLQGASVRLINGVVADHGSGTNEIALNLASVPKISCEKQGAEFLLSGTVPVNTPVLISGAGNTTISGPFVNPLQLAEVTKKGTGTLTLSGDDTVNVPIRVEEGTLVVKQTAVTAPDPIALEGGMLTGNSTVGTIKGNKGTIRPGFNGPGTLRVAGDLSLASGVALEIEANDQALGKLLVGGAVKLDQPDLVIKMAQGYTPPMGKQGVIIHSDLQQSVQGMFNGIPQGGVIKVGSTYVQVSTVSSAAGTDVLLKVVPEPQVPQQPVTPGAEAPAGAGTGAPAEVTTGAEGTEAPPEGTVGTGAAGGCSLIAR